MESTEIPAITGGSPEISKGGEGAVTRKEKRKALKKLKRKQLRREMAIKEKELEEARANDPEEQIRLKKLEEEERERIERDRREFEERERIWLEAKKKRDEEEEAERHRKLLEESEAESKKKEEKLEEDEEFEYIEEGPAEIIWKGNEIILKKKKVKVPKKSIQNQPIKQELERPISNPFPPNSESSNSNSAQEILEKISQENPNFGTEQDKANCPFQIKTGACRFGTRCTRLHFYPEKSHTLLIKNMYSGPGLAFDQDEDLEYTDEEIERSYEEFYEDVHTEFLKYGELLNFKVCRNGSYHLRGNVYVHYKSLDSAIIAYNNINGRFFAGKMITCEFVGVTKWKVAICGEFMKSRLKTCSRGNSCNFIHCFRNPGGDYEWADFDKPPPNSWIRKMASLFGFSDQSYRASKALDSEWSGTPTNDRYGSRSRRDDYDFERRREYSHSRERNYDDYDLERRREYSHSRERNYERHRSSSLKNEDRSKNDSKDRKREDEDKNNYNLKEQKRENKDKNKNSSKEQKREFENKLEIKRKRKEEKMELSIQEERYKGGVSPKDDIYLKNEYCEIKSRREKHRECSEDFVERESTHKKSKRKHDRKNGKEKHDYDYNYDSESEYSERREGNNDYDDGYDNYDYREYKRSKKDLSEDKSSSRRKI